MTHQLESGQICPPTAYYRSVSEAPFLACPNAGHYGAGMSHARVSVWPRDELDATIESRVGVVRSRGFGAVADPFAVRIARAN